MEKRTPSHKLESERVIIIKHDTSFAGAMYAVINRDRQRLMEFLPWVPHMKSRQDELNYILITHERWKDYTLFDYSLFRKSDQTYMGTLGVHTIDWDSDACELGYWILSDFEGQGYMSEAVRTLEKHLFEIGFNRIEIRCDPRNQKSSHIPISCGYIFDAHLKQEARMYGELRDTLVFSKLKQNYKKDFVTEMTPADHISIIKIAELSPEHFTAKGIELLKADLPHQKGLVLRSEDKVRGFLTYFANQGVAEIGWMAIHPHSRGIGHGTQLLNSLKSQLKAYGAQSLQVRTLGDTVDYKPYARTRSFYLRNGFQKFQSILHPDNPEYAEEWLLRHALA